MMTLFARWPLAALLLVVLLPGTAAAKDPGTAPQLSAADAALVAGLVLPHQQMTLANGLRVVVQPDHRAPVVTVHLQTLAGASWDVGQPGWPDLPGLAHFVEHLLYAGSALAPDGAYDAMLSAVGGENNAWTERQGMAVHVTLPVEALALALALEADRMAGLDPGSLDRKLDAERRVVEQERAIDLDTPGGLDLYALRALLYPDDAGQHWGVLGTPAAVGRVVVDDVLTFQAAAFAPAQTVLVVVGDVQPDAALAAVQQSLGVVAAQQPRPSPAQPPAQLPAPPQAATGLFLSDVAGTTLYASYPLPAEDSAQRAAADLLADWLGLQRSGRLGRALQHGRLERLSAWTVSEAGAGRLVVELGARRGSGRRLRRLLDRAVDDVVLQAPTVAAVERVRGRWRAWAARIQEDPTNRAEILARCVLEDGDVDCLPGHVADHLRVTPARLSAAAAQTLDPSHRALLVVTAPSHHRRALPDSVRVDLSELSP